MTSIVATNAPASSMACKIEISSLVLTPISFKTSTKLDNELSGLYIMDFRFSSFTTSSEVSSISNEAPVSLPPAIRMDILPCVIATGNNRNILTNNHNACLRINDNF